jgi:hypothetical protein
MLPLGFTVILCIIFSKVKLNSKAESESHCLSPLVVSKLSDIVPPILNFVHSFPQCHFYQVNNFCWYVKLSYYYMHLLVTYTVWRLFKFYKQLMNFYVKSVRFYIHISSHPVSLQYMFLGTVLYLYIFYISDSAEIFLYSFNSVVYCPVSIRDIQHLFVSQLASLDFKIL